jgi:hypothetical protein
MKKTYEMTRVYTVEAESVDEARAQLARADASKWLSWESVVTLPVVVESAPRAFAREAVRQLTGRAYPNSSSQTPEPRRES